MNTIRRARRRPRVGSVSFRSFAWVLLRETLATLLEDPTVPYFNDGRWRRTIAQKTTYEVKRLARIYLERHPERRIVR